MVRLKGGEDKIPASFRLFQFQNGAIKSGLSGKLFINLSSFNSKMVRLKEGKGLYSGAAVDICFNSKMVRLKVWHG